MSKPTQPKKKWETPQLFVLDSPSAKNRPNVHEHSANYFGNKHWSGSGSNHTTTATNKSSLAS